MSRPECDLYISPGRDQGFNILPRSSRGGAWIQKHLIVPVGRMYATTSAEGRVEILDMAHKDGLTVEEP